MSRSLTPARRGLAALVVAILCCALLPLPAALARHPATHHSFLHRHRVLASMAAGYAAYHVAKHTGHNRAMSGRRGNFMQRHPVMTGIGAAVVTHHVLKHHTR